MVDIVALTAARSTAVAAITEDYKSRVTKAFLTSPNAAIWRRYCDKVHASVIRDKKKTHFSVRDILEVPTNQYIHSLARKPKMKEADRWRYDRSWLQATDTAHQIIAVAFEDFMSRAASAAPGANLRGTICLSADSGQYLRIKVKWG
jgi:arginyl-tRNA--protein-N-Asp/Glu arginylyltransferase